MSPEVEDVGGGLGNEKEGRTAEREKPLFCVGSEKDLGERHVDRGTLAWREAKGDSGKGVLPEGIFRLPRRGRPSKWKGQGGGGGVGGGGVFLGENG